MAANKIFLQDLITTVTKMVTGGETLMVWTEGANMVEVDVVGPDTEEGVDVGEGEVWGGEVTEEGDHPTAILIIQIIQQITLR
jgi:hypothetical protein